MLSDSEFFAYAARHYDNPSCKTPEEFNEDLNRFRHLRKLLVRYNSGEQVNPRLILNHIIVILNVFDNYAAVKLLFGRTEKEFWSPLKTILSFLEIMPEEIPELGLVKSLISDDVNILIFLGKIDGSAND